MKECTTTNKLLLENEIKSLQLCQHPNLLQLLGCSLDGLTPYNI